MDTKDIAIVVRTARAAIAEGNAIGFYTVIAQQADEIERLHASARPKALDWDPPSDVSNGCWTAKCILGTYSVVFEDGWSAVLEDGLKWEWEPEEDPRSYSGPYAAQNACQEHFERTIRSAL